VTMAIRSLQRESLVVWQRRSVTNETRYDSGPPALAHDVPLAVMPFAALL
jgi:hypothetical protein